VGANIIDGVRPIELPDHAIATIGGNNQVMRSDDKGNTWSPVTAPLPYSDAVGIAYSGPQKAFFTWHADCGSAVLEDAIMRYAYDYESK
jgi:hypothetical protein